MSQSYTIPESLQRSVTIMGQNTAKHDKYGNILRIVALALRNIALYSPFVECIIKKDWYFVNSFHSRRYLR